MIDPKRDDSDIGYNRYQYGPLKGQFIDPRAASTGRCMSGRVARSHLSNNHHH